MTKKKKKFTGVFREVAFPQIFSKRLKQKFLHRNHQIDPLRPETKM
jgi:hypothetical protein